MNIEYYLRETEMILTRLKRFGESQSLWVYLGGQTQE